MRIWGWVRKRLYLPFPWMPSHLPFPWMPSRVIT